MRLLPELCHGPRWGAYGAPNTQLDKMGHKPILSGSTHLLPHTFTPSYASARNVGYSPIQCRITPRNNTIQCGKVVMRWNCHKPEVCDVHRGTSKDGELFCNLKCLKCIDIVQFKCLYYLCRLTKLGKTSVLCSYKSIWLKYVTVTCTIQ